MFFDQDALKLPYIVINRDKRGFQLNFERTDGKYYKIDLTENIKFLRANRFEN